MFSRKSVRIEYETNISAREGFLGKDESTEGKGILDADDLQMVRSSDDAHLVRGLNRRDFMKYSVGAIASLYLQII